MVDNTIQLARGFLASNNDLISKLLEKVEPHIEQFVPRPSSAPQKSSPSSTGSTILRLMNNPIISILLDLNPLAWIAEAVLEEAGESIKFPTMSLGDEHSIFESMTRVLGQVWDALQDLMGDVVSSVVDDPSSLLDKIMARLQKFIWMLFDELKKIGTDIVTFLSQGLDALTNFLKEEWHIPLLTDVWEDLTDCKFSILNFFTYVAAQLMNLLDIGYEFVKDFLKGIGVIQAAASSEPASRNLVNVVRFDSGAAWGQDSYSDMEKNASGNTWAMKSSSTMHSNTAKTVQAQKEMMPTSAAKGQTRILQEVPDDTDVSDQPPPPPYQQYDHDQFNAWSNDNKAESNDQHEPPPKHEPTEHGSGSPPEHEKEHEKEHEEASGSTVIVSPQIPSPPPSLPPFHSSAILKNAYLLLSR